MAPARLGATRSLHARDAVERAHRRHRYRPGARTSRAVSAAVVRDLADVSRDSAAYDRVAPAIDPPGLRLRVAPARRAGVCALDGSATNIPAAATADRT